MLSQIDSFLTLSTYSHATSASYAYCLKRFSAWLDRCCLSLESVDPPLLTAFLAHPGWSPNSRRLYGNAVKAFLRWIDPTHPALSVRLPRDNARPGRCLDRAQVGDLAASFDTTTPAGWRNLSIVSLMVETGLRASEIANLQCRDLDVRKQLLFAFCKGRRWQQKVFGQETARFLEVWLGARETIALPGNPYLFCSILGKRPGGKMTRDGLRALFRRWGITANVGRLSPHDLRRTMATLLIEAGAPTRLVQELGGWSDIRMVERYTRTIKPSQIEKYSPIRSIMNDD